MRLLGYDPQICSNWFWALMIMSTVQLPAALIALLFAIILFGCITGFLFDAPDPNPSVFGMISVFFSLVSMAATNVVTLGFCIYAPRNFFLDPMLTNIAVVRCFAACVCFRTYYRQCIMHSVCVSSCFGEI
jgi:hypothetical protein